MIRRLRDLWRRTRSVPAARGVVLAMDRAWWAHVIRRADVVDLEFVRAQGRYRTRGAAIRAYVGGAHRRGLSLNPLFHERLVASQLSEADRVPAMYAYLVNDVRNVRTSTSWDAVGYAAAHPESLSAPGGPMGHAWRHAVTGGTLDLGTGARRRSVAWTEVRLRARDVLARRLGINSPPDTTAADSVFICRLGLDEPEGARAIDLAIALSGAERHRTVIALSGDAAGEWADAALLELWLEGAVVVRDAVDIVDRWGRASAPGTLVVTRGHDAEISVADMQAIARAASGGIAAPLWLDLDGSVAGAGTIAHDSRAYALLAGFPIEDALRLGTSLQTSRIAGDTFAFTVGAPTSPATIDLSAVVRAPRRRVAGVIDAPDDRVDALVAPAGLRVHSWSSEGPRYERVAPPGATLPLRWAIKIVAPAGRPGEAWGDTHFARGLAQALRRLGQEVVIDSYDARDRDSSYLDDVVLALRGPEPFEAQPGALSLLWIISHPDEVTAAELADFDLVFAGSDAWAREAGGRFGRHIAPLLQCTDVRRFHPEGLPRGNELVFVGTARGIARPSVVEPLRAGIPLSVYGPDWRGYIPAEAIRATGVPNRELPALYESARAVLNDHWPAMQREGFISNRLYDVVAAGGRVISDHVEGIDELFGGAVLTYQTVPELIALLRDDLDARFPDEGALAEISSEIRRLHSFDARARALVDAVIRLRAITEPE